jgi:hypothetical protein
MLTVISKQETATETNLLNPLLREKLAAVETYTQAVDQLDDKQLVKSLRKIRDTHSTNLQKLLNKVVELGETPSESAEAWDAYSSVVGNPTQEIAPETVISALRHGEEISITECEDALKNSELHPDCHRLIETELLPACHDHLKELNRLALEIDH